MRSPSHAGTPKMIARAKVRTTVPILNAMPFHWLVDASVVTWVVTRYAELANAGAEDVAADDAW